MLSYPVPFLIVIPSLVHVCSLIKSPSLSVNMGITF